MSPARLYIAARYGRRDEMRSVAELLRSQGCTITSRWLYENAPLNSQLGDHKPDFYVETAQWDLADIDRADTLLFFAEDPLVGTPRGGRHVEFGYALGKFKRVVVIGGPENIFHYLGTVVHFPTVQSFIESELEQ